MTGIIRHIWMTIRENTEKGSFVMRDVVLRIYWDNSSTPAVEAPLGISSATDSANDVTLRLCRS